MNSYGSHQEALFKAIELTSGPILEIGAGDESTRQIHERAVNRKILTVETSQTWIDLFMDLGSEFHKLLLTDDIYKFYEDDKEQWGVVLVDCLDWDMRLAAVRKYRITADYLVVHDSDYSIKSGIWGRVINEKNDFSESFKYFKEYTYEGYPSTVLGSNKFEI